jgi:hypothetical protein
VKIGQWYKYREDGGYSKQAYQIVGLGRDFVVFRLAHASFYATKVDFDTKYELIAEPA